VTGIADVEKLEAQATNDFIEAARDFMDWIYRQLEAAYEFEQKDETVAENIRANEYEFTAEGKRSVTL
jgi:hypothetical protein